MEPTTDRDSPERRIGPTVSKDKWVIHAKNKLMRGYVLIVGTDRKNANFYSRERGYEMCAYKVARQLIKDGIINKVGDHHLGGVYELVKTSQSTEEARAASEHTAADEFERLLDELDSDNRDGSATASA